MSICRSSWGSCRYRIALERYGQPRRRIPAHNAARSRKSDQTSWTKQLAYFRLLWRAQGQISKVAKAAILRISSSTKAASFTACGSALIRSRYGPLLAYRALQKIRPGLWTKQLANVGLANYK